MKTTVNTKLFLKALQQVGAAIKTQRHGLPILRSVKIIAEKPYITLSGTNLDIFIRTQVECKVSKPGGVVVGFHILSAFISRATAVETSLEFKDNLLIITHAGNIGRFEVLPVEEFPPIPQLTVPEWECDYACLIYPLKRVAHSMSDDSRRYHLQGVNIHRNEDGTEFASTNGGRLSYDKSAMQFDGDIILPSESVEVILNLITDGTLKIKCDPGTIIIRNGDLEIASGLVEGTFPKYKGVIPDASDQAFHANRKDLIEAISTASIFLEGGEIAVRLTGNDKSLIVECDRRFKAELIGAELTKQAQLSKRFNYQFLLDALKVATVDTVRIECPENATPSVIREGNWIEVINPLVETNA